LANTNKRATTPVGKVLASAIANAENNHRAKPADLIVESVLIGPGPTLKRSRARAKGSSSAIRKRSSHITVIVSDGKAVTTLVSSETKTPAGEPVTDKTTDTKAASAEEKK
jgi:ribosomal protein L22